jgi:hypothetical protein
MDKITKLPNGGVLCEYHYGNRSYQLNNKLHREDGPALEHINGNKWWFLNGQLHREDGPAFEGNNDDKEWWINDKRIPCKTQKEFEQFMRLKAFL